MVVCMYAAKLVLQNILIVAILIVSFTNININISVCRADDIDNTGKESLKEVNALRVKRGLRPFIFDANLTLAAKGAAKYRAENNIEGHIPDNNIVPLGDFHFVPRNGKYNLPVYELSRCAAGCAAWKDNDWGSCCVYDDYKYAGAYWVRGRDGRRFMHLFVRNP